MTSMKNFIIYKNNLISIQNMTVVTKNIQIKSKSENDIIDITNQSIKDC